MKNLILEMSQHFQDNSLLRKVEVEKKMTSQQRKQRHLDKRKLKRLNQEHKLVVNNNFVLINFLAYFF